MAKKHQEQDAMDQVPRNVAAQGEKADELQAQIVAGEQPPVEGAEAGTETQPVTVTTPVVQTPAPVQGEDTWKHKYDVLQGKYDQEILGVRTQLDHLQTIIQDQSTLINSLLKDKETLLKGGAQPGAEADVPAGAQAVEEPQGELNPDNYVGYGDEIVEMAQRMNALDKRNQELERQVQGTVEVTQKTAREKMFEAMDKALPTWEQINADKRFLEWLGLLDPLSSIKRDFLLQEALAEADARRVLSFFTQFLTENPSAVPEQPEGEIPQVETPVVMPEEAGAEGGLPPSGQQPPTLITREQFLQATKDMQTGRITQEEFEKLSNTYLQQVNQQQVAQARAAAGAVR